MLRSEALLFVLFFWVFFSTCQPKAKQWFLKMEDISFEEEVRQPLIPSNMANKSNSNPHSISSELRYRVSPDNGNGNSTPPLDSKEAEEPLMERNCLQVKEIDRSQLW